ncbi:MAG: hypothetical protein JXA50_01885 [Deltaproteobacteria bacterium]|nr:hypothetical protein [Deltaproteobacteria bacterium]
MTLNPNSYTKQPWEEETIKIDFTERLAAGDSLSSALVTIWEGTTEKTTEMIGSSSVENPYVIVKLKAGEDGINYSLRVRATTSNGGKYEEDLVVRIRQIGQ